MVNVRPVMADDGVNDVVVLGNSEKILPLRSLSDRKIAVVQVGAPSEDVFYKYCGYYAATDLYKVGKLSDVKTANEKIHAGAVRIIAVYTHNRWASDAVKELSMRNNSVVVYFISDRYLSGFRDVGAGAVVLAGDASDSHQIKAAETVFGGRNSVGRLAVNINGIGIIGDGVDIRKTRLGFASPQSVGFSDRLEFRLDSIVRLNIGRHSFPGCQIVVVKDGEVIVNKPYGHLGYATGSAAVNEETLYDIASMTKATATAAGLMLAYDRGLFGLDVPVDKYMPELAGNEIGRLTPRELMHHETGMPSTLNTYALMVDSSSFSGKLLRYKYGSPYTVKVDKGVYGNRNARLRTDIFRKHRSAGFESEVARGIFGGDSMRRVISDAVYSSVPGKKRYLYSCLNFCILKDLEERVTGERHDSLLYNNVFGPLGAVHAMFRPSDIGDVDNVAPTEKDGFMRRQLLQGYVHDEIAAYSGGIQGNAGLFSNALDVAKLCQAWLDRGEYGGVRIFRPSTVDLFISERSRTADRGLCFDRASRLRSMDKIGLPEGVFGHTGFTGTCFWVDPVNRIIVVFLCNRINPSRDNSAFNELAPRIAIMQAVYESLCR